MTFSSLFPALYPPAVKTSGDLNILQPTLALHAQRICLCILTFTVYLCRPSFMLLLCHRSVRGAATAGARTPLSSSPINSSLKPRTPTTSAARSSSAASSRRRSTPTLTPAFTPAAPKSSRVRPCRRRRRGRASSWLRELRLTSPEETYPYALRRQFSSASTT